MSNSLNLKYENIVNSIKERIRLSQLSVGDFLPSIAQTSQEFAVAKETVVKAYRELKKSGIIDSRPGKGFYVISKDLYKNVKVLLLLNDFNPYMQVLYNSIVKNLSGKADLDVFFHHNNPELFNSILKDAKNRYHAYLVKPFDSTKIQKSIATLPHNHLLIIDRPEFSLDYSCVIQNFYDDFYASLEKLFDRLKKYSRFVFFDSEVNPHPEKGKRAFSDFFSKQKMDFSIEGSGSFLLKKNDCVVVLSNDDLVAVLEFVKKNNLTLGHDFGLLCYNDSPLNQYICSGITSISSNFEAMGEAISNFALDLKPLRMTFDSNLILRNSI
ncbi:MAG: GntR family transcriptional regulator [Spirochaetales bacterium]|nr:GntR family transcriptional regulator [Spirochaetales bacterium]